jgi:predicted DNA binding CopG/RHH family protein
MEKKKQVAIRLNEDFYKEIRITLLKEGISFQEYVETLIKKDMNNRGK